MHTNNKQYNRKSIKNSITVTPIKSEALNTQSYPNSRYIDGSVAAAATTSIQQPVTSTNNQSMFSTQDSNISYQIVTSNDPTLVVTNMKIDTTGTVPKGRKAKNSIPRKPPPNIDNFWSNIINDVKAIENVDAKHQCLPLARIKKIMKLDENAKMIAAEAPLLFAKACEFFIQELTMRAWIHTEDNKRRTLQRTDIAQAIASYDQFDFLIDIVPREEIRFQPKSQKDERASQATSHVFDPTASPPPTQVPNCATTVQKADPVEVSSIGTVVTPIELIGATQNTQTQQPQQVQIIQHPAMQPQQMQYFITIPGQQPGQTQIVQQLQLQPNQLTNGLSPQIAGLNVVAQQQPQQLILTTGPNGQLTATPAPSNNVSQQQILLQNFSQQQQQQQHQQQVQQQQVQQQVQQQPIQILQQVIGPNGEITNVPITINANQLNMLRLQQQQQQQQQQNNQAQQQLSQQVNILFNPTQTTTATVAQLPTHNTSNTITSYRPNC